MLLDHLLLELIFELKWTASHYSILFLFSPLSFRISHCTRWKPVGTLQVTALRTWQGLEKTTAYKAAKGTSWEGGHCGWRRGERPGESQSEVKRGSSGGGDYAEQGEEGRRVKCEVMRPEWGLAAVSRPTGHACACTDTHSNRPPVETPEWQMTKWLMCL